MENTKRLGMKHAGASWHKIGKLIRCAELEKALAMKPNIFCFIKSGLFNNSLF